MTCSDLLHATQPDSMQEVAGKVKTSMQFICKQSASTSQTCRYQELHSCSNPGKHMQPGSQCSARVDKQHSRMPPNITATGRKDSTLSCSWRNHEPVLAAHENLKTVETEQEALASALHSCWSCSPGQQQRKAAEQPPKHQPQQCRGPGQQAHRPAWAVTGALPRLSPSPWACRHAARAWRPPRRPPHPRHRRPRHHRRRRPVTYEKTECARMSRENSRPGFQCIQCLAPSPPPPQPEHIREFRVHKPYSLSPVLLEESQVHAHVKTTTRLFLYAPAEALLRSPSLFPPVNHMFFLRPGLPRACSPLLSSSSSWETCAHTSLPSSFNLLQSKQLLHCRQTCASDYQAHPTV